MLLKYHRDPKYLLGSIGVTTPPILSIKKQKDTCAHGFFELTVYALDGLIYGFFASKYGFECM